MTTTTAVPGFATLVREFFCGRLIAQQNVSTQTVASYRDAFRLLLNFFTECRGRPPTALTLVDLDAPTVLAFLDHLEQRRGNCVRTRNARLAALRSFLKYAATRDPACLPIVQRVLAITGVDRLVDIFPSVAASLAGTPGAADQVQPADTATADTDGGA